MRVSVWVWIPTETLSFLFPVLVKVRTCPKKKIHMDRPLRKVLHESMAGIMQHVFVVRGAYDWESPECMEAAYP